MAERKSVFSVELKGNAAPVAKETSAAVDQLAESIKKGEDEIKAMSAELRRLRGSTAEVKSAKDKLKAAIAGARQEVTRDALELRKLGATTADVTAKQKKLAEEQKKTAELEKKSSDARKKQSASMKAAIGAIGGPAEQLSGKLSTLTEITEGLGSAEGVAAVGAGAAAAAVLAVGAAAVYGAISLTKFIIESQSAAREMNLLRTAAGGAEINGINMGTQVDALSKKVPILKGEINRTAIELERFGLRGQTIVDTLESIEQAAGVGDEGLASFAKDVVERGKMMNRFQLSPAELFGKNLRFDDIAAELATGMHTSIDEARQALLAGTVDLESGAAAMKNAMKRKFGGVNEALMLDPRHQVEKFEENLRSLTTGVNIEPLLHDMRDFFDLFDPDKTTSGAAIKQLVSSLGGDLVDGIHQAAPAASDMMRNLILGAIKINNHWLEVKITIKKAIDEAKDAIDKLKSGDLGQLGRLVGIGAKVVEHGKMPEARSAEQGITNGLVSALGAGLGPARYAGAALANAIDTGFRTKAEIHSPSRVMQRNAEQIVEGATRELRAGQPSVYDALNVMMMPILKGPSSAPSGGERSTSGGGVRDVNLNVKIEVGSERAARALEGATFQAQLKKTLAEVLLEAGFGVPA